MKKHIVLFFILLIVIAKINAQQYIPFPTDSAQWSVRHTLVSPFSQTSYQYKMKGDTLLNGIVYHKVYYSLDLAYDSPNETLHCFVREDTTKKVFVKYPVGSGIDTAEFMLYDFNLIIGDSVTIRLFYFTTDSVYKLKVTAMFPYPVNSIDTPIYYQLEPIPPITWPCTYFTNFAWMDGFGSFLGPFYNEIPEWGCDSGGYEVSCFWYKGVYVWGGTFCDYITGIGDVKGSNYQSHATPNPAQNSINFEVNFEKEEVINSYLIIADVVGRQMGKYSINANNTPVLVNTETYSNGIYFYSVYNNSVLKETAKFIINK